MATLYPPDYPDCPDAPLLSFGPSFSEEISRSVMAAVWHENHERPYENEVRVAAALTMLEAFHPRDHLECMLAAQGVAAHAAMMECFRRAMLSDMSETVAIKLRSNAVQLSRMFSTLLHDMERRQSKPLPQRPGPPLSPREPGPPPDGSADDNPLPDRQGPAGEATDAPTQSAARTRPKRAAKIAASPESAGSAVPPGTTAIDMQSGAAIADATLTDDFRPANSPSGVGPGGYQTPDPYEMPEIPEDVATRPDGTPGSLAAYAPKPPVVEFIPGEPAIMIALATRPRPWRMVNVPAGETKTDGTPTGREGDPPEEAGGSAESAATQSAAVTIGGRGPLDLNERIFTGDALSRFASARFDPDAQIAPPNFDDEDSVVELELISTGGDPEAEAKRAEMIAAHPEGKPIVTFRHGSKKPPDEGRGAP